jgi:hypothetical protein
LSTGYIDQNRLSDYTPRVTWKHRRRLLVTARLGLFLGVWALLLFRLNDVPPGLQHDQTFTALDARYVLDGHLPLYFPANFGREPLFMYSVAAAFLGIGQHIVWSLRFTSVLWGMVGLAATLALARRYLSETGALVASALMATSFWYLLAARLGLEPIALLPLTMAFLYFLDRGLERPSLRSLAAAGFIGGIAIYTYLAARTLFLLIPLLLLYEGIMWLGQRQRERTQTREQRRRLAGLVLAMAVLLVVSGPLLIYLRTHPQVADLRTYELSGPLAAVFRGDLQPILGTITDTIRSVLWLGSRALPYQYNIPGRGALGPFLSIFFVLGLILTVLRLRERREALLLAALLLGVGPSLLTGADALYMRAIYVLPLLAILATRGLWAAGAFAGRMVSRWRPFSEAVRVRPTRILLSVAAALLLAGLLLWHSVESATAYFLRWADADQTQRIYNADFRAAARFLAAAPAEDLAFIGTDRLMDLDRRTYELYDPKRPDVDWFALPDSPPLPVQGDALYLIPSSAQMPPALAFLFAYADDHFSLPGPGGKYDLMQGLRISARGVERALMATGVSPAAPQVTYGDALRLERLGLRDDGSGAELITRWMALAPWPRSARPGYPFPQPKLAVALVDDDGYKWVQADEISSLPVQDWRPGQALVDVTPLALPGDLPPGSYGVQLGMYDDEGGPLPVRGADGRTLADAQVVGRVEILAANRGEPPAPPFEASKAQAGSDLRLLGSWEAPEKLIAGVPTDLHVSWQAMQPLATAGLEFRLKAVADDGTVLWEQPADPAMPLPAEWPAGQVYRLTHRLEPATIRQETVRASLELCAEQAGATLACAVVGQPAVLSRKPAFELPAPPQHAANAHWGETLTLAGYDLAHDGQIVTLTLYWRADVPAKADLKRFVHAVDAAGQIVVQSDVPLESDGIPAAYWRPGEYVVDRVALDVPAGSEIEALRLGLYDAQTQERLPVEAPSGDLLPERMLSLSMPGN